MIIDHDAERDHAARLLQALGAITDGLRAVGGALECQQTDTRIRRGRELLEEAEIRNHRRRPSPFGGPLLRN